MFSALIVLSAVLGVAALLVGGPLGHAAGLLVAVIAVAVWSAALIIWACE